MASLEENLLIWAKACPELRDSLPTPSPFHSLFLPKSLLWVLGDKEVVEAPNKAISSQNSTVSASPANLQRCTRITPTSHPLTC